MIRPSQRRRSAERPERNWVVHRRLARNRDLNRHLLFASVLALLAALAGWLLGLDLPLRMGAVAVAALSAWLVPLKGSTEWALRWIGDRAGLAYQTALEMDEGSDPYGLKAAVEERANASLTRVERPEHSAWWLPLLALAVGALLLPALPLGNVGGFTGGPTPPGGGSEAPVAAGEEPGEEPAPNLPQEERTRVPRSPEEAQPGAERGDEGDGEGDGQAGEREALERYLRNIRERPAELAEEQDPGQEGSGSAPSGRTPQEGAQQRPGEGERGAGEERSGEGDGERTGEQAGSEGQDQGQSPQEGSEEGQQNPFSQAGSQEDESEAGESGEAAEPGDGQAGEEQLQEGGEEAPAPGESQAGGDQEGQGQGAGGAPSREQEADRAGGAEGETVQLQGDLGEGPSSSGGTVQLPGGDEIELPPGRSAETYSREVERAISEGRVPLEYQEIIRNYFR